METVLNAFYIKVNKCCASCKHKECMNDGTRFCSQMMIKVEQKYECQQWQMSDGLKSAGMGGGVVRLKSAIEREQSQARLGSAEREQARRDNVKGTAEIILK